MDITASMAALGTAAIFIGFIAAMAAAVVASLVAIVAGLFAFVFFVGVVTHIFGEKKVLDFVFVAFPLGGSIFVLGGMAIIGAFVIAFVVIWIFATVLSFAAGGGIGGLVATIGGVFMTMMGFVTTGLMAIVGLAVVITGLLLTYRTVRAILGWIFPDKKKTAKPVTA